MVLNNLSRFVTDLCLNKFNFRKCINEYFVLQFVGCRLFAETKLISVPVVSGILGSLKGAESRFQSIKGRMSVCWELFENCLKGWLFGKSFKVVLVHSELFCPISRPSLESCFPTIAYTAYIIIKVDSLAFAKFSLHH